VNPEKPVKSRGKYNFFVMKTLKVKFLFLSILLSTTFLFSNQKLKASVAADADCKKASQTCMIVINHGQEKSYPGLLTIN